MSLRLTVVILTLNEERHIARAIGSVSGIADRVVVVDSGSTDATAHIAAEFGARVLTHPFTTQAKQFNWALEQLPPDTGWVLRLDADEIVTPSLAREIAEKLGTLRPGTHGVEIGRRMTFLGRPIRWGGVFPIRLVRLLRHGHGRSEDRWMDEHITIDGAIAAFAGEIVDDNLNPLSWWTSKHNGYSSREVVEILDAEHGFLGRGTTPSEDRGSRQASAKRWIKENLYARLPIGFRALLYFLYRYVLRLGFLDGVPGLGFHLLQGFWYRFLVDLKLYEVRIYMRRQKVDTVLAIRDVLGIDVTPPPAATGRDGDAAA